MNRGSAFGKAKKLVAIFLCSIILAGALPLSELGWMFADAAVPQYNNRLGTVEVKDNGNGTSTLTAKPNNHVGFRGWYLNGNEVSAEKSYTVDTKDVGLYEAEFYDFNLIVDGDFEDYAVGDDMKLKDEAFRWEGYCDSEARGEGDWTTVTVTADKKHKGEKSLKTTARFNTTYKVITGLETDTQYTVSFWYTMEVKDAYLSYVAVIDANDQIDAKGNSSGKPFLAYKQLSSSDGKTESDQWKEISITFHTGDITSVCLIMTYNGGGNVPENNMYIDDLVLEKNIFAAPTYGDRDFSNGYVGDWTLTKFAKVSNDAAHKRLKVSPELTFAAIQASPYYLKKDYTYTVSFDLDLSELKYVYAPEVDRVTNELVYDDRGELVFSTDINWINWNFSTEKGAWGSKTLDADEKTVLSSSYFVCDKTTSDSKFFSSTVTDADGSSFTKTQYHSSVGFGILDGKGNKVYKDMDFSKPVTVTSTFTADHSGPMYLNVRLNGIETYYIDNIKISETEPTDKTELINVNALDTVGMAIRIQGKQGIRYKTEIDKRLLTADNGFGVRPYEYGTVAIKTAYLQNNELVLDGKYSYGGKTRSAATGVAYRFGETDVRFLTKTESILYTGVLVGISEDSYQSGYSMRSYLKYKDSKGNDKIVYSKTYSSSIFDVAKAAYSTKNADGSFAENAANRAYLFNNILNGRYDRTVTVDDSDEGVIFDNYEGINSTVYHCFTFMPDSHGRAYTEEEAAIEMDRLADSGIDAVRTIFKGSFAAKKDEKTASVNLGDTNHDGTDEFKTVKTGETFKGWDWNSTEMQAFYKWAKMLQARDIDIILNPGWHLHFIVERESSIPELFYLLGYEGDYADDKNYPGTTITYGAGDLYNETANYLAAGGVLPDPDKGKTEEEKATLLEERRLIIASLRYGEWVRQALAAAERNGVKNIKYIHPFTETGYEHSRVVIGTDENGKTVYKDGDAYDSTYCYDEYIIMVKGLHNALKKAGVREKYKFIGPSQSIQKNSNKDAEGGSSDRQLSLLGYYLQWEKKVENKEYEGMLDILSSHMYAKPTSHPDYGTTLTVDDDTIYHPTACYESAELNYQYYMNKIIADEGGGDPLNRTFWSDEYFANAGDITWKDGVGAQMTQFAAGMVAAINNGLQKQLSWQIFDQLFTNQTNTGGEFTGGVHCCGTAPSFVTLNDTCQRVEQGLSCSCQDYKQYASLAPRITYYGINLLGRYLSSRNGLTSRVHKTTVLDENNEGGVYVATIRLADGNLAILAVNTKSTATALKFNFKELAGGTTLKRYTYNPEGITPTEEAKSLESDGTVTLEGNTFYDTIADMSFAIYTNYEFSAAPIKPIEPDDSDLNMDMTE